MGILLPSVDRGQERSRMSTRALLRHYSSGGGGGGGGMDDFVPWENRHSQVSKGATRAAVLGALDGLVSNLCLILGVIAPCLMGKESDKKVLLTGVAGIFAGAFSMAVGEWLSITAENEYMAKEIETEREHIIAHRQEENVELIEYLVEQGLQEDTARQVVADLETRPDATARLLNMHARFHWGIDEDDLGGSASLAAGISFVAFASGGFVPLIPWILPCGSPVLTRFFPLLATCLKVKLAATLGLSIVAMFVVGFVLASNTPTSSCFGGFRHTLCGVLAAAMTFGIGYVIGTTID